MPTSRLIVAALLLTAPLVAAQQAQPQNAAAKTAAAHSVANARRLSQPEFEPLQITIIFKRIRGDKTTTQKTYTVTASSQQADPQLRDDSRIPMKKESAAPVFPIEYVNGSTDVDVQNIRKVKNFVSLTLRIATEGYSEFSERPSVNASLSSHRYTISPTVPMGKCITVYSMADGVNNYKVEVQLLVEPLKEK
jgi:hypothetical protein